MWRIKQIEVHAFEALFINIYSFPDLMIRDTLVIELREQIQAYNRENEISFLITWNIEKQVETDIFFDHYYIWRERIRREVEVDLNLRYAEKKKEFEQRMEEDTKIILQKQDELLEERREAIAKEEQEQMARIQQIRQSHELSYPFYSVRPLFLLPATKKYHWS